MATVAPCIAKPRLMALPMPRLPPVTSATRSSKRGISSSLVEAVGAVELSIGSFPLGWPTDNKRRWRSAYPRRVAVPPTTLGEIIRRQRELSELSMRQFADMVGISNPYMSQIERGLREPSEKVLGAIARNLDLSAEALYELKARLGFRSR